MPVRLNKILLIFAIQLLLLPHVQAQTNMRDSLDRLLLTHTQPDTVRLNLLVEAGIACLPAQADAAMTYGRKALALAVLLGQPSQQAYASTIMGNGFQLLARYDSAMYYYKRALSLHQAASHPNQVSNAYNNIGLLHEELGQFTEALAAYQQVVDVAQSVNDSVTMGVAYVNRGIVYDYQGRYNKAIENYLVALRIFEPAGLKSHVAAVYNNIAIIHKFQDNDSLALVYYKKALEVKLALNDYPGLVSVFNNIGTIYTRGSQHDTALYYYTQANTYANKGDNMLLKAKALHNIGTIYLYTGQYKAALEQFQQTLEVERAADHQQGLAVTHHSMGDVYFKTREYPLAAAHLDTSLAIATRLGLPNECMEAYAALARLDSARGNYYQALANYQQYISIKDSLFTASKAQQISELQTKYETEQKERAITSLQIQNHLEARNRRLLTIALAITCTAMVLLVWLYVNLRRTRNTIYHQNLVMKDQNEALAATNATKDRFFTILAHDLKAPLVNLLTFISAIGLMGNEPGSTTLKEHLSYLRRNLQTVTEMIDNLLHWAMKQRNNIKVNRQWFNSRHIVQHVADSLMVNAAMKQITLDYSQAADVRIYSDRDMLAFIIRNLVSNALKFTRQGGHVAISCALHVERFELRVHDNGVGIDHDKQKALFSSHMKRPERGTDNEKGSGLGLTLCRQFTEQLGGVISVVSQPGQGTTFIVNLPVEATDTHKVAATKSPRSG